MGDAAIIGFLVPEIVKRGEDNYAGSATLTVTYTGVDIGPAAADRLVICIAKCAVGAPRSIASATIAGVAATVYAPAATNLHVGFFWAVVPTGTTATIAVTWDGNVASGTTLAVFSMTGQDSNTPVAQNYSATVGTTGPLSLGAVTDGASMVVGAQSDVAGTVSFSSPVTNQGNVTSTSGGALSYGQVNEWAGGTLSFTHDSAWMITAVAWR